jgi:hypothetical protein
MLTRIREEYDERHDTPAAIEHGLARTCKLVTSAALILMFAFFVLSDRPGLDSKQFGIGLSAGIIFDATITRALVVPSLMQLLGRWNWWMPTTAARLLLLLAESCAHRGLRTGSVRTPPLSATRLKSARGCTSGRRATLIADLQSGSITGQPARLRERVIKVVAEMPIRLM